MEGFNGRIFDRPDHSLSLAIGPWVVGLGLTVLDTILHAYRAEDMIDERSVRLSCCTNWTPLSVSTVWIL